MCTFDDEHALLSGHFAELHLFARLISVASLACTMCVLEVISSGTGVAVSGNGDDDGASSIIRIALASASALAFALVLMLVLV